VKREKVMEINEGKTGKQAMIETTELSEDP
jgi:hypothetical protein